MKTTIRVNGSATHQVRLTGPLSLVAKVMYRFGLFGIRIITTEIDAEAMRYVSDDGEVVDILQNL